MECVICGGDTGYCGGCEAKTPALQDLVRALDKAEKLIAEWPAKRAQIVAAHPGNLTDRIKILAVAAVPLFLAKRAVMMVKDVGPFMGRANTVINAFPEIDCAAVRAVAYKRGDWVRITYATSKTRLALIHDRSDRLDGNYRGIIVTGNRVCAVKTIFATEIIGPALDDKHLRTAKELVR